MGLVRYLVGGCLERGRHTGTLRQVLALHPAPQPCTGAVPWSKAGPASPSSCPHTDVSTYVRNFVCT